MPYYEDNVFYWDANCPPQAVSRKTIYGQFGGKVCLRYNQCSGTHAFVDGHGDGLSGLVYGVIYYEMYGNVFTEGAFGGPQYEVVYYRGGTMISHNNTFNTTSSDAHQLTVYNQDDIHRVVDSYFWNNTWNGVVDPANVVRVVDSGHTTAGYSAANIRLGYEYFLTAPQLGQTFYPYAPLAYPHPLIAETEGVNPVFSPRQALWHISSQTAKSGQALWSVLASALISHDILWNVSGPETVTSVSNARGTTWNVAQAILAGGVALWNVRIQLSRHSSTAWNVEVSGTSISGAQVRRVYVVYELFGPFGPPPNIPQLF
jgi:hypothetical protein